MDTDSIPDDAPPPKRRRRQRRGPRREFCHAPLPPLRGLRRLEVARGARYPDWPWSLAQTAITLETTSPTLRRQLRARVELRYQRIRSLTRHADSDLYWLSQELRLLLGALPAGTVRRWRRDLEWKVSHAEGRVKAWAALTALVQAHEPAADRWLRKQLGELESIGGAR